MLKILEFIFQDLLHFLGTILLLSVISSIFKGIVYINKKEEKEDK